MPVKKGEKKELETENEKLKEKTQELLRRIIKLEDWISRAKPLDWMREPENNIQTAFRWENEVKELLSEKEKV